MVKLKPDPITSIDLIEYLDNYSDFSFEIETLKALIQLGFECEHGGTYEDPATQKPREYDIRAIRKIKSKFLRLAIECKNLRPNFPLLISCLPRRPEEAFYEISISDRPTTVIKDKFGRTEYLTPEVAARLSPKKTYRLKHSNSLYPVGEFVGKSCDQVGRAKHNDSAIFSDDSGIYD